MAAPCPLTARARLGYGPAMTRSIPALLATFLGIACATTAPAPAPAGPARASPPAPELCAVPGADPSDPVALLPPAHVDAPPADAERSPSGLAWKVLRPGCGTLRASSFGLVRVHYTGWTTDGRMFDSSVARGKPAEFSLHEVITGWREAVKQMAPGEKRRLWVPEELAYKGSSGPQGTLVFDVELLEILKP